MHVLTCLLNFVILLAHKNVSRIEDNVDRKKLKMTLELYLENIIFYISSFSLDFDSISMEMWKLGFMWHLISYFYFGNARSRKTRGQHGALCAVNCSAIHRCVDLETASDSQLWINMKYIFSMKLFFIRFFSSHFYDDR